MARKGVCPHCGLTKRTCNFKKNIVVNKKICGPCDKKIGHNPFYEDPKVRGAKSKSKYHNYNIKFDESQALYKEYIKKGLSEEEAKKKVQNRRRYVNWFQWKKKKATKEKNEGDQNIMKRLLEGLK